jgi:anaerobic ribonucleoside-triphosphate reductase
MRYKCHTCHMIIELESKIECPNCGETHLQPMCELDHICNCPEEVTSGILFCSKCKQPMCPCGSHDVVQISRVTGYLSDVGGWNKAKLAELKDRSRYNISDYQ